jgi:hypothetical protein
MFEPWKGSKYENTRLLILGESAYSWWEADELQHPSSASIKNGVEAFSLFLIFSGGPISGAARSRS